MIIPFRPKTVSSTITDLVAGTKYYMFVISVYKADSTEFKLGFESTASGLNINPITKEYMSWKAQGKPLLFLNGHYLLFSLPAGKCERRKVFIK
jgi:hypothetical protein